MTEIVVVFSVFVFRACLLIGLVSVGQLIIMDVDYENGNTSKITEPNSNNRYIGNIVNIG